MGRTGNMQDAFLEIIEVCCRQKFLSSDIQVWLRKRYIGLDLVKDYQVHFKSIVLDYINVIYYLADDDFQKYDMVENVKMHVKVILHALYNAIPWYSKTSTVNRYRSVIEDEDRFDEESKKELKKYIDHKIREINDKNVHLLTILGEIRFNVPQIEGEFTLNNQSSVLNAFFNEEYES